MFCQIHLPLQSELVLSFLVLGARQAQQLIPLLAASLF
jgi:hypothetical protein